MLILNNNNNLEEAYKNYKIHTGNFVKIRKYLKYKTKYLNLKNN